MKTQQNTLFDFEIKNAAPLAERMRPQLIKDFVGQKHIVSQNTVLWRAIKADRVGSCIFWGPPGTGKTTLANVIANSTNCHFEKLNAVASGVADAKKIIDEAQKRLATGKKTYLLLDECHRWSKAQSDCVLGAVEQGIILFIGSTTENPYASLTPAIVSRCRVFEFHSLDEQDIKQALKRALVHKNGLQSFDVEMSEDALDHIAWASGGDLRTAYNALELAVLTTEPNENGKVVVDKQTAVDSIQKKALSVDESSYYDMISAFCKSLRGSDEKAAMFWFARLISAGCDPMLLARRLVVHSAEDVGMADPNAMVIATSAMKALEKIGMPEARIPMAEAIIYVCRAPKSNYVVNAIDEAFDLAEKYADAPVPNHIKYNAYQRSTDQEKTTYLYPHDFGGWVEQQYLPDVLYKKDKN
ncbi:MAG: replication-associated recombination protein A [Clostridiales bacterium]|nr:replication-associated recombination protein A [Clostridiales bacterium]